MLEPDGERTGLPAPVEPEALSLSGLSVGGQVRVADLSATGVDCALSEQGDRQLVFPLAVEVSIGEGAVTSSGTMELWAAGPDPATVSVNAMGGRELPADLSGGYEIAFEAWYADKQASFPDATDWMLEGLLVVPYGTLDALEIDVEADYQSSNSDSLSVLWRGVATYPD